MKKIIAQDQGTTFRSQFSSKTSVQPSCESFYISNTSSPRLPYDEGELRRPQYVIGLKALSDVDAKIPGLKRTGVVRKQQVV